MKELIKIQESNGNKVVSARELHTFLGVTERFANWFERQKQYGFEENVDFVRCKVFNTLANQELIDYAISIDMAKEVSMIQRSEKGKQARRYFIEMEKIARNPIAKITKKDLAKMLLESEEEKERLEAKLKLQEEELLESAPKALYYDEVMQSKSTYNTNLIAKELGMSAITLNKKLKELGVQYKQNEVWVLYHKYQNKGFTKTKTATYTDGFGNTKTSMTTVWTEEGRKFIHSLITENQPIKNYFQ